jgi:hypothetical protein
MRTLLATGAAGFILVGLSLTSVAQPRVHVDKEHHFEAQIPPGWHPVREDLVEAYDQELEQRLGSQKKFRLVSGFSVSEAGLPEFPYVLFQFGKAPMNRATEAELIRAFDAEALRGEVEDTLGEALSDIITDVHLGTAKWDPQTKRLTAPLATEIAGVGPVRGIMVGLVGSHGLVQINCYARASQFEAAMPAFQEWIDGLRIEDGYEWHPGSERGLDWGKVGRTGLIGGVVGAIGGLVLAALRRRLPDL